jgi:hypothetical protein
MSDQLTEQACPADSERRLQFTACSDLEIVAAAEDEAASSLPRFRMVAYTGGPMRIAGWRYPLVIDLAGLSVPSQSRPIRFAHDALSGVGHTDAIRVEDGQLIAAGLISRDTPAAREVVASAKNGFPWQASVGASVDDLEFIKPDQTALVNGKQFSGPLNVVRRSTLGEISFVDLGADGATSASVSASHSSLEGEPNVADENQTADAEETDTDGTETTETEVTGSAPSQTPETVTASAADSVAEIRAAAAAELERIAQVRNICNGRHGQIEAQAIREGWDAQRTELEVLRNARPSTPAIHAADNTVTGTVLEAACLMTAKLDGLDSMFEDQTLEAASRRFRGGIGLQELILEAAWANGYSGRNFRNSREAMQAAFGSSIEAGWSGIDIGGILSNVANKFLLDGFFSVERTWRNICATRNVSDFKTVTSYRLVGKDQYERVAPGGELKHGTLGEEQYSNKADTYGLMLSVDRTDIINDDLGAITAVPRKLGRGSGLKINDVFWSTFLANSDFFKAANNNFLSGATTALSIDGLTAAEVAFMDQVDGDGKPIGIMPSLMLVPTALSAVGSQLFKSLELRDTTASTKYPVTNPHQGKFRVEVSRYLSNAAYTGNSSKAWYLLADPNDLPVIEVAFLNGQESPTIETADADFNVLGVQMRGYHDFGCAMQDPRGGVKNKGEA